MPVNPFSKGEETYLQATARRPRAIVTGNMLVVTQGSQKNWVRQQLPDAEVLTESCGRNTAGAIGYAAAHLVKQDADAVMLVLPCDHVFENEPALVSALNEGIAVARETGGFVLIGIKPTFAHPELGYIQCGGSSNGQERPSCNVFGVKRFHEKPGKVKAKRYWRSGEWFWNSGMFVMRAQSVLDALLSQTRDLPGLSRGLRAILDAAPSKEASVANKVYPQFENTPIDKAVMEKLPQRLSLIVPYQPLGWDDVGNWASLSSHLPKDANGNTFVGTVHAQDVSDCLVHADDQRVIALLGVEGLVVFQVGRITLVVPKDRANDLKALVDVLPAEFK